MFSYTTASGCKLIQLLNGRCNVYFLTIGNENILIDTGRSNKRATLFNKIQQLGISKLDYLVLTHAHFDHTENAYAIKKKFNPKIVSHESEVKYLSTGTNHFIKGTLLPAKILVSLFGDFYMGRSKYEPCVTDIEVQVKWIIPGWNAYLLHTPGHTIGSISLIIDNEIAIASDTLFGIIPFSVLPPYAADYNKLIQNWGLLLDTPCKIFLPMHGGPIKRELLEKSYKKHSNFF